MTRSRLRRLLADLKTIHQIFVEIKKISVEARRTIVNLVMIGLVVAFLMSKVITLLIKGGLIR
jgi:hypothetical protein